MRKPSKPWYRSFNDTWYVCRNGEQIPLAKGKANKQEAERAFHRLMAGESPQALRPSDTPVVAILDLFLDHSQKHNKERTYAWYREFLQDFAAMIGMVRVADLKPFHVTRWLDAHSDWKGCRRGAIVAVKRAFNWAAGEGLIAASPIKTVKKPPQRARERFLGIPRPKRTHLRAKSSSKTGPPSTTSCKLVHYSCMSAVVCQATGGGGWSKWTSTPAYGRPTGWRR